MEELLKNYFELCLFFSFVMGYLTAAGLMASLYLRKRKKQKEYLAKCNDFVYRCIIQYEKL